MTMLDKKSLRKVLIAQRAALSIQERRIANTSITRHALEAVAKLNRGPLTVGAYWPIQHEPDSRALMAQLHAQGHCVALPVTIPIDKKNGHAPRLMNFKVWTPHAQMAVDAFGIATPVEGAWVRPDVMLAPCIGFCQDAQQRWFRLGFGGGYYDSTLASLHVQGVYPHVIGVAYANARTSFAIEAHDVPLNAMVTERDERKNEG